MANEKKAKGLSLFSGGLDSQLAIRVLERAGAYIEAITFVTPFFPADKAIAEAKKLGVKLHLIDFTDDEVALIENPPHGFGSAMNPCIDCHATMMKRAGELMNTLGFDFIATGEVINQRPMSQNKQALKTVEKSSGLEGRLVRPLSALLLDPSIPEQEGLIDRTKLCDLSGRRRERQAELAKELGITDYPSPGGGCKLTEDGFSRRLRDLMEHETLHERRLLDLLSVGRRFRLEKGSSLILGRDVNDNRLLASKSIDSDTVISPVSVPGPTGIIPRLISDEDMFDAAQIVCAWSKFDRFTGDAIVVKVTNNQNSREIKILPPYEREKFLPYQVL
ncbi:MAG: tRNA 4-thiouridine(8) synthase ThiI [Kiritimatiellae bacterium]|nr:tRNA 4-thiouridine(8) synthase ThiI [Kiritimatiellia bacterium]